MMLSTSNINLRRSHVMAIVNVTPDSFYSGSRTTSTEDIVRRVERVIAEGATIIDIGGYSSRPNATEVSLEEEWERVRRGLEAVAKVGGGVAVSVDSFRAEIIRRAVEEFGEVIVNDISAGEQDAEMLGVVARYDLPYVAMHMRGTPQTMQSMTEYEGGVVAAVVEYFTERVEEIALAGVRRDRIILDPGFGFAKSMEQNYELLRDLDKLRALGYPLLVGLSRKSMIYKPLGITPEESLSGSLALAWEALRGGSAILRVHDVAETAQILRLNNIYRNDRG
ncbi:MAG: dihydropteroate synthase [Alistipes sp.]|nr:dihydropteroate synthase [Alistipes sp.]